MREAVGAAYRCLVAGSIALDFPELAVESKPPMDKHFPVENNNHSSSAKKRASRRYCTSQKMGRAARGESLMARKGSFADTVLRK
jgi:hypothetical protein